jgi:hypothetical protein
MTAKTNAERQAALRTRRKLLQGLAEVRGLYAPPACHAAIKAAAAAIVAPKPSEVMTMTNPPKSLDDVLAAHDRLHADAARYRWLRDQAKSELAAGQTRDVSEEYPQFERVDWLQGEALDRAIDAEMAAAVKE